MPFYKGLPLLPPVSPYHVLPFLSPISLHNHLPLLSLSLQCLTCWFCSFFEVTSVVWLPTISLCSTLLSPESLYNVLPFLSPLNNNILLFFLLYIFTLFCPFLSLLSLYNLIPVGSAVSARWSVPSDSPLSRRPFLWIMALCLTALLADDSWGDTV